jgi:hypothetical protein
VLKKIDAFAVLQARKNRESASTHFCNSPKSVHKGEAVRFSPFKAKKNQRDRDRTGMFIHDDRDNLMIKLLNIKKLRAFKHKKDIKG